MTYMLDTNICIYFIKKRPEYNQVLNNIKKHLSDGICISSITLAELEFGVENSSNPQKNAEALVQLFSILTVLPFDDKAAAQYGKICAYLRKKGTPIGTMDMLISAHAKSEGLILVTNNEREFKRVPNLTVENWIY